MARTFVGVVSFAASDEQHGRERCNTRLGFISPPPYTASDAKSRQLVSLPLIFYNLYFIPYGARAWQTYLSNKSNPNNKDMHILLIYQADRR